MAFIKEKAMEHDKKWAKALLTDEKDGFSFLLPYEWLADKEKDIYFFILCGTGRGEDLAMSPDNVRIIFNKKDVVYIDAWIRDYVGSKRSLGKVERFIVPNNLDREYVFKTLKDAFEIHFLTKKISSKLLENLRNLNNIFVRLKLCQIKM